MLNTLYCSRCKQYKPEDEFRAKSGRIYSACRECRRAYGRQWMRNKDRPKHDAIWGILRKAMGNCCSRCGYKEFTSALEFHLIDERDPSVGVVLANMVNRYVYSPTEHMWSDLLDKVEAHVLLCSNCRKALRAGEWEIGASNRLRAGLEYSPHQPAT